MKHWRALLVVIAIACFAVALYYPISYRLAEKSNNSELEELSAMRRRVRDTLASDALEDGSGAFGAPSDDGDTGSDTRPEDVESGQPVETARPQGATNAQPEGGSGTETAQPGTVEAAPGSAQAPGASATKEAGAPSGTAVTSEAQAAQGTGAADDTAAAPEPSAAADTGAGAQTPAGGAEGQAASGGSRPEATGAAPVPEDLQTESVENVREEKENPTVTSNTEGIVAGPTPPPATPSPPYWEEEGVFRGPWFSLAPGQTPDIMDLILEGVPGATYTPTPSPKPTPTQMFGPTLTPSPTPDRNARTGALSYNSKEKVVLDEDKILPELREIYALNHDLVGWIFINDTLIDYPVVQTENSKFYLDHDFYGNKNSNGQIILDTKCDPYTPSYNLIISGHHMNNGSMFGKLPLFRDKKYWETRKIVEFDTLMERKKYVIFAVFYSADYDVNEKGFRYNADVQYRLDAEQWLAEIRANQLYDTGIDAEYGDEFITLTTCDRSRRRNGRFVAVGRRIRKGEVIK